MLPWAYPPTFIHYPSKSAKSPLLICTNIAPPFAHPPPGDILPHAFSHRIAKQSKFQFSELTTIRPFLVSARKGPKEADLRGATGKSRPLRYPPPHRHPAFKNVPIFERLHSTKLQVYSAEPAENRDIFSGRWSLRREWGPGRGCDLPVMPRPGRLLWLLSCSDTRK